MYIIIDNGHGKDTPGKRSPDGTIHEWLWTRRAAALLAKKLTEKGIECTLLVPEESDILLKERIRRANAIYATRKDAILISLHVNAAGDGSSWHNARGFSAFVAPKASTTACRLAAALTTAAADIIGNRATPPEGFWRANFAILRGTRCPAVLTENLFMDNHDDVAFLASEEGLERIVDIHMEGGRPRPPFA